MSSPSDEVLLKLEVESDKIVRRDLSTAVNAVTLVKVLLCAQLALGAVIWRVAVYVGGVETKIDSVNRRGKATARYAIETRDFVKDMWPNVYHGTPLPPPKKPPPSTSDKDDRDDED